MDLVQDMLTQVMKKHPEAKWFHIGADEVGDIYSLRIIENSHISRKKVRGLGESEDSKRWLEANGGDMGKLFLNHVTAVGRFMTKLKKGIKLILWDDMFRKLSPETVKESGLQELASPMIWNYIPNMDEKEIGGYISKYEKAGFKTVWFASAFKGASGIDQNWTPINHHLQNHLQWQKVIASMPQYKSVRFQGLVLTGWQRYEHHTVLCELLPVAIPSLAVCLQTLKYGSFEAKAQSEVQRLLGCQIELSKNECKGASFPGSDVYEMVKKINDNLESSVKKILQNYHVKGSFSAYNRKHNFANPRNLAFFKDDLKKLMDKWDAFLLTFRQSMEAIFYPDTLEEWLEENVSEHIERLHGLVVDVERIIKLNGQPKVEPLKNSVATETEVWNDMTEENNNTAATVTDQTEHSNIITIQTTLGDEDEDIHKCGRCLEEFSALDAFIQHKLSRSCKRPQQDHQTNVVPNEGASIEVNLSENEESSDEAGTSNADKGDKAATEGKKRSRSVSEDDSSAKVAWKLNAEGRYICDICEKTFKTTNILRTHMFTHTDQKDFKCEICETAFRTKGSLIRHKRRHTDERPYRCNQCGLAFRESGALTRHLKSLTPCTEKIRYSQCKEILVSKDGVRKEVQPSPPEPEKEQIPVVRVVEAGQEIIQIEVVGQVQQVVSQPQTATVVEADNLICQAIINSGIALETEATEAAEQAEARSPKAVLQAPETDARLTEIQVTEECVETMAEETQDSSVKEDEPVESKLYKCPHCERMFKTLAYLRVHVKGHVGYKPFKCLTCQKEFLTGYVLKKHMETHVSERRYKCGECGKQFKAIGHVREHMRAHSDERPYHCSFCDKSYKTKNALQVHHRTHGDEKPYVCPHCSRGFREKSALVRHIRHHTGEKPFKCSKCGRGFAEHGTLNRHLRAKGGCFAVQQKDSEHAGNSDEQEVTAESVSTTIVSDDPHAVLVEFSSVMDSHIMKVVQQIVSQSHGGHQIIVRNVAADETPGISDCGDTITIATPESLTEQVAMTLANAISDGTILTTTTEGAVETPHTTVTMVTAENVETMEQEEQYVIASPDEMEIQTVVVV
ncbi:transcription factor E4F1 [Labeo rohita]|uniref:Transcription factor E4F1 n=1 Tax=Labeo rohita TaxID=84645 RepID=A0A498MMT7_LABRO|nr:transcription factor E4F1 [Labeo rohita]RXN19996.1 transcription factor E4F1 [Labeo rohita]